MDIAEADPKPPKIPKLDVRPEERHPLELSMKSLHLPHGPFVMYHPSLVGKEPAMNIFTISVPPDLRGYGIGTRLEEVVKNICIAEGIHQVIGRVTNPAAISIREKVFGTENVEFKIVTDDGETRINAAQAKTYLEGSTKNDRRAVNVTAHIQDS